MNADRRWRTGNYLLAGPANTWWIVRLVAVLAMLGGPLLHAQQLPARVGVFENEFVKMTIPAGWAPAGANHPAIDSYRLDSQEVVGSAVEQSSDKLLLQKEGFTLALAFQAEHASGIVGGRFIEMFRIPWLNPDDAWSCSLVAERVPQPVSRRLLFFSLYLNTGAPEVRKKCAITRDLAQWRESGTYRELIGEERWLGGYFSTDGSWFFDSDGNHCREQVYTLTTDAQKPEQLQMREDRKLNRIVSEAIDIVASIQYKRCPPALAPYARREF